MKVHWIALALAATMASCGPRAREGGPEETKPSARERHSEPAHGHDDAHGHDHEPGHGGAEHDDHDGRLHVDPAMVRDLRVRTAPVESRSGGEGVSVLGELQVNEDAYAEIGPPVAARVVKVLASAGDIARPGTALVELQSQELGQARSEHATAQARLAAARVALERKRGLAAERVVPRREVQDAEAEAAALEAAVEAARGAVLAMGLGEDDIAVPGSRFTLRSPVAGTVIERRAVVGQVTDPAKPLFRVGDLRTLWLEVHAFERDAVRVKPGATARIALPAMPGQSFTGRVALVGRQVDPGSRTIAIRITLDNPSGVLRPGMSATAWLPVGEEGGRVLAVPATAVQRLDDQWVVFLPTDEEAEFRKRIVGRGRDLGGEVEIVSGLEAGEPVVVEGAFLLKAEAEKARGAGDPHHH